MQIRIRQTGAVVLEQEFCAMYPDTSFAQLDEATLDAFGADVVFEGAQATGGTVYQYSQRDGVEQVDGKWYTRYVLGPVFTDTTVDGVTTTAAEHEAAYIAIKDAEFQAANAGRAKLELEATDWCENASVRNPAVSPHLSNFADFDTYRLALRVIAIMPPVTVTQWPVRPVASWV